MPGIRHRLTYTTKPPQKNATPITGVKQARDPRLKEYVHISHEHPGGEDPEGFDSAHPYDIYIQPDDILELVVESELLEESTRASWMPVLEGIFFYKDESQTEIYPFSNVLSYKASEGVSATVNAIRLSQRRFTEERQQGDSAPRKSSVTLELNFNKLTKADTFYYLLRFANVSFDPRSEPGFGGSLSSFDVDPSINLQPQEG